MLILFFLAFLLLLDVGYDLPFCYLYRTLIKTTRYTWYWDALYVADTEHSVYRWQDSNLLENSVTPYFYRIILRPQCTF